jgi:hypothetical protein
MQVAPSSRTLSDEAQLMLEAHRYLVDREPAKALESLAEHERRFPSSGMRQERAAARIVATCELGKTVEARQQWQKFVTDWPESPFGERIRSVCHWPANP